MKQFMRATARFIVTAVLATSVTRAFAGIADSPLPELEVGKSTSHLYSVPGVMGGTCFATYFSCTSMDTAPMRVGVELFFSAGGLPANDAVVSSLSVNPGATVVFGTRSPADPGIGMQSDLGFISQGSARILTTSKKLACTAFVADRCNYPVTFMRSLTIIKGTKQKAAN